MCSIVRQDCHSNCKLIPPTITFLHHQDLNFQTLPGGGKVKRKAEMLFWPMLRDNALWTMETWGELFDIWLLEYFSEEEGPGPSWWCQNKQPILSPLCNYESIKILRVGGTLAQSGSNIDLSSHLSQSPRQLTASRDINSQPRLPETQLISDHPRDHSHSPHHQQNGSKIQKPHVRIQS